MSAPEAPFEPFVSPDRKIQELTPKAVFFGILFAAIFGASSVYLALGAGLTVGGSISVAVVTVGVLKRFGKTTLLENGIVQTIGSTGEAMASGLVFRLTGLLFLVAGLPYFHYYQLITISIVGGLLGVLMIIPLRRHLVVEEYEKLPYPEGQACAEVLVAGERQGPLMRSIFFGSLIGAGYWVCMRLLGLWKEIPYILHRTAQAWFPNATLSVNVTPEYLGIGYIIGPRAGSQMMLGGAMTWLVLIPLFSFMPKLATWLGAGDVHTTLTTLGTTVQNTQTLPSAADVYAAYGKFIGMGAIVCAGMITLVKAFPLMMKGFRDSLRHLGKQTTSRIRTDRDIPMSMILLGLVLLFGLLTILPAFPWKWPLAFLVAGLILFFGFFFSMISGRFVGIVGYSMDPVTSMMLVTVMTTCLLFLSLHFAEISAQPIVLIIGATVCLAAGHAGVLSQDLKIGALLGATPWKQQVGAVIGVVTSSLLLAGVLLLIDHSIPSVTHAIGYVIPGEDSARYLAPQANIVSMLIQAVLGGKVPWGLVGLGAALSLVAEVLGLSPISFASGLYFPISTTTCLFAGACLRYVSTNKKRSEPSSESSEVQNGMLYATGLVAGGAMTGMLLGFFTGFFPIQAKWFNLGHEYWKELTPWGDYGSLFIFALLGILFWTQARSKRIQKETS